MQLKSSVTLSAKLIFLWLPTWALFIALPGQAQDGDAEASAATKMVTERSQLPGQIDLMNVLAEGLPKEELLWLGENDEKFISLYRPAHQPAQMSIVLLAANDHQLLHAKMLRQIYLDLPDQDWSTLTVLLPPPNPIAIPKRPTKSEAVSLSAESPESTDQTAKANSPPPTAVDESNSIDFDELAAQRINLAIQHFTNNGSRSVTLFSSNASAKRAIKSAISNTENTSGLIFWKVSAMQFDAEQLKALMESRVTVLDIIDSSVSPRDRKNRLRLFKMAGFELDYRLIEAPPGDANVESISRRVRHWLNNNFAKL